MQNIKYNNKDYTFFNTGEHYFTEKTSYPLKKYDGYTVVSIFCDEVSYINTKPVILDASSMNINYNRPGNVFIPMDENEEYYDIRMHNIKIYTENLLHEDRNKLYKNYTLIDILPCRSFGTICVLNKSYTNIVPVISIGDNVGISLEENASLKLKRYLK